jgi:hypothetical protein
VHFFNFLSARPEATYGERRALRLHAPESLPAAEAPGQEGSSKETEETKYLRVESRLREALDDPRLPAAAKDRVQRRIEEQRSKQEQELAAVDQSEQEELRAEGARLRGSLLELERHVEERQALTEDADTAAVATAVFPEDGLDPELAARARDLFAERLAARDGLDISLELTAAEAREVVAELAPPDQESVPSFENVLAGTRDFRRLQDENLPEGRSSFGEVLLALLRGLFEAAIVPPPESQPTNRSRADSTQPENAEEVVTGISPAAVLDEEPVLPTAQLPCGPVALAEAFRRMGIPTNAEELETQRTARASFKRSLLGAFDRRAENITWPQELVRLAQKNGVSCARFSAGSPEELTALGRELSRQGYTVIAREQNGDRFLDQHYVVLSDGREVFNRLYETPRIRELYVMRNGTSQEAEIAALSRKVSASTSYSVG